MTLTLLVKVPMRTSVVTKSTPKLFSASCVPFMASFTSEKISYIFRSTIKILWSDGIFALRR